MLITVFFVIATEPAERGVPTPTLFRNNVFVVSEGASSRMPSTVMLPGKFTAVECVNCTVFELPFVIRIVWPAPGRTPSDQLRSSQFPLVLLVQALVCAAACIPPPQSANAIAIRESDWTTRLTREIAFISPSY